MYITIYSIAEAENLGGGGGGGQEGLKPHHFLIRGAEPPKIGGCREK